MDIAADPWSPSRGSAAVTGMSECVISRERAAGPAERSIPVIGWYWRSGLSAGREHLSVLDEYSHFSAVFLNP
jgi:hypothetical protein